MLPILRILPVGGVSLAILILVLALSPPSGLHTSPAALPARGALMLPDEHPEWRQFLMLAAMHRAEQLSQLGDLPDMPVRGAGAPPYKAIFAGLPVTRSDAEPDDETGSIAERPNATIPIEIGEPSSTELPVNAPRESPPVITTPERVKVPNESRNKKSMYRARRTKPSPNALAKSLAKTEATPPAGLDALFGVPPARVQAKPAKLKPTPAGDARAGQPIVGGMTVY